MFLLVEFLLCYFVCVVYFLVLSLSYSVVYVSRLREGRVARRCGVWGETQVREHAQDEAWHTRGCVIHG